MACGVILWPRGSAGISLRVTSPLAKPQQVAVQTGLSIVLRTSLLERRF